MGVFEKLKARMRCTEEPWEREKRLLREALKRCQHQLRIEDVINVSQCIDAGETGLAFDTLCTQLYEYDAQIPEQVVTLLADIGQMLQADPELWEDLATDPGSGEATSDTSTSRRGPRDAGGDS